MMLIFLCFSIRYVFIAYKHFKIAYFDSIGLSFSDTGASSSDPESSQNHESSSFYDYNGATELRDESATNVQFRAFSGQGTRLG